MKTNSRAAATAPGSISAFSILQPFAAHSRRSIGRLRISLAASLVAAIAAALLPAAVAEAKTPGKEYCFYGTCHRVSTIAETQKLVGKEMVLNASFYDHCSRDSYNPCGLTSSGEAFRPDKPDNAASPIFPDGTTLLVYNPKTKAAAVVRVNNAGPYWGKRKLDLSRAAAEKLGFRKSGVADLKVRVIKAPTSAEATYRRNRRYAKVPGYIGEHANLGEASRNMTAMMAINAIATSLLAPVSSSLIATASDDSGGVAVNRPAKGKARGTKSRERLAQQAGAWQRVLAREAAKPAVVPAGRMAALLEPVCRSASVARGRVVDGGEGVKHLQADTPVLRQLGALTI